MVPNGQLYSKSRQQLHDMSKLLANWKNIISKNIVYRDIEFFVMLSLALIKRNLILP